MKSQNGIDNLQVQNDNNHAQNRTGMIDWLILQMKLSRAALHHYFQALIGLESPAAALVVVQQWLGAGVEGNGHLGGGQDVLVDLAKEGVLTHVGRLAQLKHLSWMEGN